MRKEKNYPTFGFLDSPAACMPAQVGAPVVESQWYQRGFDGWFVKGLVVSGSLDVVTNSGYN
jgi:hypothetical protein